MARQQKTDRGADTEAAFEPHAPSRLPDEAIDLRQAQARPLSDRLRREKRLERPCFRWPRPCPCRYPTPRSRHSLPARLLPLRPPPSSSRPRSRSSASRPRACASRALIARFSSTFSSWLGSQTRHSIACRPIRNRSSMAGPQGAPQKNFHAADQPHPARSSEAPSACRREKAKSRLVKLAPHSPRLAGIPAAM